MLNTENTLKHIGLQFFAEPPAEPPTDPEEDPEDPETDPEGGTGGKSGKSFSQDELNALLKKEKTKAQRDLLKELGAKDTKSAKESLTKYQEYLNTQKTELELEKEKTTTEATKTAEAEARAAKAEAKVLLLSENADPKLLDDLLTLAMAKVTDDKDLEAVVKEMKTQYPNFFEGSDGGSGDKGTGGGSGYRKKDPGKDKTTMGQRLAASRTTSAKNDYFTN